MQQELDESSSSAIQADIQQPVREVSKIEGGEWTTSETANKEFVQELKKRKIDVYQHVSSKYKGAERLRASIYNDIRQAYENQNEEELLRNIGQLRRRAVYGFYISKEMDKQSKRSVLKISNF